MVFPNLSKSIARGNIIQLIPDSKLVPDQVAGFNERGGRMVRMINKTGATSVKGTVVETDSVGTDFAFKLSEATDSDMMAVIFEDGIPDGQPCFIVTHGPVQALLKDATASTRGNWVHHSDVAGRVDATLAIPPLGGQVQTDAHFTELGHCMESVTAGVDKLAWIFIHFN